MTQAPATPELVERLKDAAERFLKWAYDQPYSGSPVISIPRHPNNIDAILCEAADALEAQQARIAELAGERDDFQRMYRHWSMIADQRLGASNRQLKRARDLQALADRYEKALREIQDLPFSATPGRFSSDIARQALSSQGRHEGVTSGSIPESPGVNAVPLPASPDGPSQMDRVWAAVNVLGAPDTACTTDEDRAYCRAIGDALSEIEKLGGRPQ